MLNKVLINWGSYDVDNFGDLLFPFIVNHYLGKHYSKIIHASPTGKRSRWLDAIPTCNIGKAIKNKNIGGLIIGGGNLISFTKSGSINYVENEELANIVHPSFFYVPYFLRAKYKLPYAFNHVGVSKPILSESQKAVEKVMNSASFISCRDKESASRLYDCGVNSTVTVGVDSAIDISKVFTTEYLSKYYNTKKVREKYNIPNNKKLAVIHVKKRYLNNQFSQLSHLVSFLLEKSIHPIFIPLGMCHEDELIFNNSIFKNTNATVIKNPEFLLDILSIIALSDYYIGSSLHGAIASISYNKKIAIIADETQSRFSKFSGFLTLIDLPKCLFSNWSDLVLELKSNGLKTLKTISESKISELENRPNTWNYIKEKLQEPVDAKLNISENDELENSIFKFFITS